MLTLGGGEMGGDGMTCCRGTLKGARQDAGLDKMFQISFTGAPQKTFSFDIDCSPQLPLFNLHSSPFLPLRPILQFFLFQDCNCFQSQFPALLTRQKLEVVSGNGKGKGFAK